MKQTIRFLMATVILIPIAAWFLGTHPNDLQIDILKQTAWIMAAAVAYTFVMGEITRNNSQVDKLWSILPAIYAWYMTAQADWNGRMALMSVLATLWAIRLSYNFARRGGYSWKFWEGEEDYRWEVLRKKPGFSNPIVWMIFNLLFICFYQNALVFLFTVPILGSLHDQALPLGVWDYVLTAVFLGLLVMETIADQQQWNFQTEKYRRIKAGEELGTYGDGFVSTGLWSKMRHPNYTAEQSIWVVFYLFSVAATGEWLNWTVAGCVLLIILFQGSADFSEGLSADKYPKYKEYQKKVRRFLPKLF